MDAIYAFLSSSRSTVSCSRDLTASKSFLALPDNSIWANITFLMLRNTVLVTSLVFLWYFLEPFFSRGADKISDRLSHTMDINVDEY